MNRFCEILVDLLQDGGLYIWCDLDQRRHSSFFGTTASKVCPKGSDTYLDWRKLFAYDDSGRSAMRRFNEVESFGAIDADADQLLDTCFEDHEAYLDAKAHRKFLIIGRKGSGKTAIYRKVLKETRFDAFSFGHDFSDYPWQLHEKQADMGVPEEERFVQSWRYLVLMTLSKILLNQDHSQPWADSAQDVLAKLERFVVDTYSSRDPDIAQIFSPARRLRFKSSFEISWPLKMTVGAEGVPMSDLPVIVQEVNRNLARAVVESLNLSFDYYVCFDQLDLGFDNSSGYKSRLIGLLLAAREINIKARQAGKRLSILVFLRDDIYQVLGFEDKNKLTENYTSRIEWDTSRTSRTLKQLMEKRFAEVLAIPEQNAWNLVFDEQEEMTSRQSKYQHMLDRTFLRPRDMIKFTNEVLEAFKKSVPGDGTQERFNNRNVQEAREEYSAYLLRELDDEIPKHHPQYPTYIEILKSLESLQFTLKDFTEACEKRRKSLSPDIEPVAILAVLFEFSLVGYYAPGGGGFGGSQYIWRYKDVRSRFNEAALNYRIHAGLKEVLGLRKWTRSE